MSLTTVMAPHGIAMRITAPLTHVCPYRDEVDEGTVTITWETEGRTFELHALREWLGRWKDSKISHEHLTSALKYDLNVPDGLTVVLVSTKWNTAALDVVCSI